MTQQSQAAGPERSSEFDWEAAERSPAFRELVRARRRFVVPAMIFFLSWYFGFIVLAGYAEDFMGREFITDGFTVGYALALTQFVMVWVLVWLYLRIADRRFDPLAERAAKQAASGTPDGATAGAPFDRTPAAGGGTEEVTPS
jgi:uncharacterized membrane protein (DUF485 family)